MYSYWHEYNPNPEIKCYTRGRRKGKKLIHADCVVRAFTILFNLDWKDTYIKLAMRGLEINDMPNQKVVWSSFLKQVKDIDTKVWDDNCSNLSGRRMKTVAEIATETACSGKAYLCHTNHHVVVVKGGEYWDSWDSGQESVRSLWELDENQ